jgi:threonine dehydratase
MLRKYWEKILGIDIMSDVTMNQINKVRRKIAPIILKTPLLFSVPLTEHCGISIYLKLENLQNTGTFKIRGAANKILSLSEDEQARGVITFSTGNHGRAVAYVAQKLGIKAVVCISNRVPQYRVDALERLGAEVVVNGTSQDDAMKRSFELLQERNLTMVNAFDDPYVIAGQGTISLELWEEFPEIETVIVPLSGGGLLSGVAQAIKSLNPKVRVIGVSMESSPAMYHSLKVGHPIEIEEKDSIADALLGGIGLENQYTFNIVRDYVDEIILLSEQEIKKAMMFALEKQHLVVEGAGAVCIAALLNHRIRNLGNNVVVIISGGNVDVLTLLEIARSYIHTNPGK